MNNGRSGISVQELNTLVGQNIKHYRKLKEWTGAKLARKAGIKPQLISWYEHGKHFPSGKSLINLSGVLGVEVWQLFKSRRLLGI